MLKDQGGSTTTTVTSLKFLYYFSVTGLALSLLLSALWLVFILIPKRQKFVLSTRKAAITLLTVWIVGLFLNMIIPSLLMAPMYDLVNMIN